MTRTTNLLLLFISLFLTGNEVFAQTNYSADEVIIQFTEDATATEITAFLDLYNLNLIDGPTPVLEFYLAQIDPSQGFPNWIDYSNFVDPINGVIVTGQTASEIKSIGLKYFVFSSPPAGFKPPLGGTSAGHSPLYFCNGLNFSINIPMLSNNPIDAAIFDTGIIIHPLFTPFFEQDNLGINYIINGAAPIDDNGHGTHITSSATLGGPVFLGLDHPINLSAYKTHDKYGLGNLWYLIQGVDQAIADDKKIANFSLSFFASYEHRFNEYAPLNVAIQAAQTMSGTLFIAAAGNEGVDIDDPNNLSNYPAAYLLDNIIAVTAIDCSGSLPHWANTGNTSVDIAAPGVDILGLNNDGEYQLMSGTSSSTALVTRTALQLATINSEFDYAQIRCAILNGAEDWLPLEESVVTGGYLDATNAFSELINPSLCNGASTRNASATLATPVEENSIQLNGTVLNITSIHEQPAIITICNALGQVLSTQKMVLNEGNTTIDLNWSTLNNPALYLINVQLGQKSKTLKSIR